MDILIVEDELLVALAMTEALEGAGHRVVGPAPSVAQALYLTERAVPDLALVDINLRAGGDGTELARRLREHWNVPSLFVSGQTAQARKARDAALGCVAKPYTPETILAAVEAARRLKDGAPPARVPPGLELY